MSSMTEAERADLERHIEDLVNEEVKRATAQHGQFHSPHEGWAVMREEYKEAKKELRTARYGMYRLDQGVRDDEDIEEQRYVAEYVRKAAAKMIVEGIQLAATARRYVYACDHRCGEFIRLPEGTQNTP